MKILDMLHPWEPTQWERYKATFWSMYDPDPMQRYHDCMIGYFVKWAKNTPRGEG